MSSSKSSSSSGHRRSSSRHSTSKISSPKISRSSENISSHIVLAILSTLFCCVPTGIVAIYFAAKVDSLALSGNRHLAREYSDKAKVWSIVSISLGLCFMAFYFAMAVIGTVFH